MTIGKTRANELVSLLKDAVEDPLSAALSVAAKEPDTETRHAIVEAAATAPGQRITTRSVQLLTRYARQAAKAPETATALADRLAAACRRPQPSGWRQPCSKHSRSTTAPPPF